LGVHAWNKRGQAKPVVASAHPQATEPCEGRLAELECKLKMERLRREEAERAEALKLQRDERVEAKELKRQERADRAEAVRTWRREEGQRRKERAERRGRFFAAIGKAWRRRQESLQGQSGTARVMLALGIPATVALVLYAVSAETQAPPGSPPAAGTDSWEIIGLGLLVSAASFAVGALLGFLFGIPRSAGPAPKAEGAGAEAEVKTPAEQANAAAAQRFIANTNLEQISDWLTKILVGVGLIQIHEVSGAVEDLANGLAPGLGAQGFSVAVTLLIAFSVTGFVSAYLYTRLRLQTAFERALTLKQVQEEVQAETTALTLVQEQLNPGGENRPTTGALTEALRAATEGIRKQAFFLARRQRHEKLAEDANEKEQKEFGALSIPVLEALIDCEQDEHYPRLRAELAYALLGKPKPDFAAAREALDEAIALRKPADAISTPRYELYRAFSTVELEPSGVSPDPVIDAICNDLDAGIRAGGTLSRDKRLAIERWLGRNANPAGSAAQRRAAALLPQVREVPEPA
jgi:hypothetical protein